MAISLTYGAFDAFKKMVFVLSTGEYDIEGTEGTGNRSGLKCTRNLQKKYIRRCP